MVQRSGSHDVGFRNHRSNYESGLTYWYRGNSWLAISQINFVSRFTHPNLKAIAPWEGMTDLYAQNVCRGGVPNAAFGELIARGFAGMYSISYEHHGEKEKS